MFLKKQREQLNRLQTFHTSEYFLTHLCYKQMNEIIILSSSLDTYQSSASGLFLTRFTEGKVVGNHLINGGK